jgi:hypothetical protein
MAIEDVSPYCWTVERNGCTKCERPTKSEGLGCVEDRPKDRIKVGHFKAFGAFPTPLDPSIRMLRPGLKHCPSAIRDIWDSGCSGRRSLAHGGSFSTTDVIATCDHEKAHFIHAQLTKTSQLTQQEPANQPTSQSESHQRVYNFSHRPLDVSKNAPCHRCIKPSLLLYCPGF